MFQFNSRTCNHHFLLFTLSLCITACRPEIYYYTYEVKGGQISKDISYKWMKLLFHQKLKDTYFVHWFFLKLAQKQPNPSLFLLNKYIFHLFCFNPLYVLGLHQKIFKYVISKFEKKSVQNKNSVLVFCIMFALVLFQLVFRL